MVAKVEVSSHPSPWYPPHDLGKSLCSSIFLAPVEIVKSHLARARETVEWMWEGECSSSLWTAPYLYNTLSLRIIDSRIIVRNT